MNKKILLIGSKGFLGSRVKDLATTYNYEIIEITGKDHVDITDLKLFQKFLKDKEVDCIINCAAFVGGISFGYKYQADLLKINSLMACKHIRIS
jgi:dTDP-4-dehydrorhamnose reductase